MAEMVNAGKGKWQGTPLTYLFFILLAYVMTGILLLTLAFLLYRFQLSSKTVSAGVIVIYLASTFFAGFLAGKKAKTKKYLWGFLMGLGYFLILAALSLLIDSAEGGMRFLPSFFLCTLGGVFGGMVS